MKTTTVILSMMLISLLPFAGGARAAEYGCSNWQQESGVSCIFAGRDAKVWKRDCSQADPELTCKRGPGNTPPQVVCLSEVVCHNFHPASFDSECSPWVKERGIKCGVSGRPTAWARACTWELLPKRACTEFRKSYPTEEDYVY